MRGYAAKALWQINKHPAAIRALVEALKDADENVRNSAAQWLKTIDPEAAKKAGAK